MKALAEVFYQPGILFSSLSERRRTWIVPFVADILLILLTAFVVIQLMGMETIMRQRFEASTRLSPEQKEQIIARARSPVQTYASYAVAGVQGAVGLLAIAGMLLVFANMTNRQPRFSQHLAMVSYAFFPYWLITCAMTTLILIAAPDRTQLNVTNLIATNAAAFMNPNATSKGIYTLASSLDLLSLAEIALLSYGFAKLNRTSIFFGLAVVTGIWLLYVFVKLGLSSLF
jgi:Yip1-like protein